jgi:hypothetical protein
VTAYNKQNKVIKGISKLLQADPVGALIKINKVTAQEPVSLTRLAVLKVLVD